MDGPEDRLWGSALHTWALAGEELERLPSVLDRKVYIDCVKSIAECRGRIITTGVGTSAAAARKIAHSLSCIERPAFYLPPSDAVHGGLGAVQFGDLAIAISKGGATKEVMSLVPALKAKKVKIIGVTENPSSPLAKGSDIVMKIKVKQEADSFNMLATTSTMTVVAVFDAICVGLIEYTGYTREQFAVIHPGGAVGKRLLEKHGNSRVGQ